MSVSVLVVYESMFGNTREIAEAVASGLAAAGTRGVALVAVDDAPAKPPDDVDLLVVGGPTFAFGMTRPRTRQDAPARPGAVSTGRIGVREWLQSLGSAGPGLAAATFDTRIKKPRVPGSAGKGAARRSRSLGFEVVAPPETFWVRGTDGPLDEGERGRARDWGAALAAHMAQQVAPAPAAEPGE